MQKQQQHSNRATTVQQSYNNAKELHQQFNGPTSTIQKNYIKNLMDQHQQCQRAPSIF